MFHPTSSLLDHYATGELPPAPGLVVAAHLGHCAACSRHVGEREACEAQRLLALPDAALREGALQRALDRLHVPSTPFSSRARNRLGDVSLPQAVAQAGLGRRRWIAPGFWVAPVKAHAHDGWRTVLLRAPAGATVPRHQHRGEELTVVLAGAVSDGVLLTPGDFVAHGAGSAHGLVAAGADACVCLIASRWSSGWTGPAWLLAKYLGL